MDSHNTKRSRQSSSSSPPEIARNGKKHHLDGSQQQQPPSSGTSFDHLADLSFGVFDFPWLKDGLISKSDDWKLFEDVFFTSLNSTSTVDTSLTIGTELLWCNLPDPWAEEYEARTPPLEGGAPATEGMDCIWSSLLNQPIQQGSRAL